MSTKIKVQSFGEISIDQLMELVRIAETAERYEDMCKFVKQLIITKSSNKKDLNEEERNCFSIAYKYIIGSKRASWRTLESGFDDVDEELTSKYKKQVENSLESICKEVIDLLIKYLIPLVNNTSSETEVFYLKMVGDYFRYLSEFRRENEEYKSKAREYYSKALNISYEHLLETNPIRLGLSLNFSVWYYEIAEEYENASKLSKKAFDDAINKLDTLNNNDYKDSTLIMQLLRDNYTLWKSWTGEQNDNDDDEL